MESDMCLEDRQKAQKPKKKSKGHVHFLHITAKRLFAPIADYV